MGKSALLHGIGKLVLPDRILLNPIQQLQGDDLKLLRRHTEAGCNALSAAEARLGNVTDFLRDARDSVYSQHECWDGSGSPQGLLGEQIALTARLMAVVSAYAQLSTHHLYRPLCSHAEALQQISAASGTRFDPSVVLALIEAADDFAEIAQRLDDSLGESIVLTLPAS